MSLHPEELLAESALEAPERAVEDHQTEAGLPLEREVLLGDSDGSNGQAASQRGEFLSPQKGEFLSLQKQPPQTASSHARQRPVLKGWLIPAQDSRSKKAIVCTHHFLSNRQGCLPFLDVAKEVTAASPCTASSLVLFFLGEFL